MEFYSREQIDNELSQVRIDDWTYAPAAVEDWPIDASMQPPLIPVDTAHRARIAKRFGRYFKTERRFDFPPYEPGDESDARHIYLIGSREFLTLMPIAVGAVEVRDINSLKVLEWVWIHPMERGQHRWERVWRDLSQIHGDLHIRQPISASMRTFLTREGLIDKEIFVA
ncbi:MAG TPA: hypothetical protein VNT53_00015 [Pseudolysinimonas sp.]|nr:hypothetical protein [Pseudolysinimonas sp.]